MKITWRRAEKNFLNPTYSTGFNKGKERMLERKKKITQTDNYHVVGLVFDREKVPMMTGFALIDSFIAVTHGRILTQDFDSFVTFRWSWFWRVTISRLTTNAFRLERSTTQIDDFFLFARLTLLFFDQRQEKNFTHEVA